MGGAKIEGFGIGAGAFFRTYERIGRGRLLLQDRHLVPVCGHNQCLRQNEHRSTQRERCRMARTSAKGLGRRDSTVLRLRVPLELMSAWQAHLRRHEEDGPELLRRVMAQLVGQVRTKRPESHDHFAQPPLHGETTRIDRAPKKAVKIMLTQNEYRVLTQIAEERECSIQFWLVGLVRAALTQGSALGGAELKALGESTYQMTGIGRNLNQVARRMNSGGSVKITELEELIHSLAEKIEEHRRQVHELVRARSHRWELVEHTHESQ